MSTTKIDTATLERLINIAWASRAHIDTGDGKLNTQLRDELRESCNAARGAVEAQEIAATRAALPNQCAA